MTAPYRTAHVSQIPTAVPPDPDSFEWKPVRHHFDVRSFGVNAFVAPNEGDWVIEDHTETQDNASQHEELYFVASGKARFEIDGQELAVGAGTFVFVPDPAARRGARALEPGTTVLVIGGKPGAAYSVSDWEKKYL